MLSLISPEAFDSHLEGQEYFASFFDVDSHIFF